MRIDPDGTVSVAADGLQFPDGSLSNRWVWASLGPEVTGRTVDEVPGRLAVAPDGCTLDADGCIWAADAVGGRVVRVAEGGEIADAVAAPEGPGIYACMLGGEDGRTLLVCAAPDFYEHNRAPVREAVLLAAEVDVPRACRARLRGRAPRASRRRGRWRPRRSR